MTRGQERTRARKQAVRQERIRQAKAKKRAQPGGLAGAGVNATALTKQAAEAPDLYEALALRVAGNPERDDVIEWMGETHAG